MIDQEIWKDIPGHEGSYQVSSLGRVKSLDRYVNNGTNKRLVKERILKTVITMYGYLRVDLYKNKLKKRIKVHQLVAMAFLGHEPCGMRLVVNHINFDKTDNRLNNLEIVSNRENSNRKHLKSSSKYTGVSLIKKSGKWRASIRINGKGKRLGNFNSEIEAHYAYQKELKKINDLAPILDEMETEGTIIKRPIIHGSRYFIKQNQSK